MRRLTSLGLVFGALVASVLVPAGAPGSPVAAGGLGGSIRPTGSPGPARPGTESEAFDERLASNHPPSAAAKAAAALLARDVPGAQVTWDTALGTARLVVRPGGYLTGPAPGPPLEVARAWLSAHRDLLGLTAAAIGELAVTRDARLPGTGMSALVLRVTYGGLPTFAGGTVGVNVAPDGRILTVWANTGPTGPLERSPAVSAAQALQTVARRRGVVLPAHPLGQRPDGDRLTIFEAGGGYAPHNVRLVAFPTASGPMLAWRVFFAQAADELLTAAVDAGHGGILFLSNQVVRAEGKVFRNYPGAAAGGTQEVVSFDGDPAASPQGWIGALPTTAGNNTVAFTDWLWPKLAPGMMEAYTGQEYPLPDSMPVAPDRRFDYDFENHWGQGCTPTALPEGPAGEGVENPSFVADRDPSVTNAFYLANRYHDLMYPLGFTEAMGNYQIDNFGKGGRALDPVRVMVMAGILNHQVNNAFFFAPADGGEPTGFVDPAAPSEGLQVLPPFTGMFLQRPAPGYQVQCSDLAQDAHTFWHELTHGVTMRVVGGPDAPESLVTPQSGAMGEGWSDWFALELLHQEGLETGTAFSPYGTGNARTGIRNFALDANPLTYGDFGYAVAGPEVHNDGEIWSATLWDLRTALIERHGAGGAERAAHLVFDALALAGGMNPTFLDQRDGILAADVARYQGQDTDLIWRTFARRGMGPSASTTGPLDVHPRPAFDLPGGAGAVLTGTVTDSGGRLPRARILLGLGEGNPTPAAFSGDDGTYSLPVVPGIYDVSVSAPGYGAQPRGRVTIGPGETRLDFDLAKNLASLGWGAAVTSGLDAGTSGAALIDDQDFTGQTLTVGAPVVVKLAGTDPVQIRKIAVAQRPSQTGLVVTAYTVEVSSDGNSWAPAATGGVPKAAPTPQIPEMGWVVTRFDPPVQARFVRLTVTDTLFGQPPDGSPWQGTIGDLEVFGTAPPLALPPAAAEPEFRDHGVIRVSNASAGDGTKSVTEAAWKTACARPPEPLQGVDAWVTELPEFAGDGTHQIRLANRGGERTDLDISFWDATCTEPLGRISGGTGDEDGLIPDRSRWVVVTLFSGTTAGFDVQVVPTVERVRPPAH